MIRPNLERLEFHLTFFKLKMASLFYALTRPGLRNRQWRIPVSLEPPEVKENPCRSCQALRLNFVHQFNERSCSVASVSMVLNAARMIVHPMGDHEAPITQEDILARVDTIHWRERVSRKGYHNRRGLPIEMLGIAVESSFATYRISFEAMDVVALHSKIHDMERRKEELRLRLIGFEKGNDTFLIAHFNQGIFTGGPHIPHISPVGAFDHKKDRVMILDVDPELTEPYWVPFETFFKGLTWDYYGILKKFGYVGGGYVWICLKPSGFISPLQ